MAEGTAGGRRAGEAGATYWTQRSSGFFPPTAVGSYRGAQAARETRLHAGVATTRSGPRIRLCSAGGFAAIAGTRCTAPRYAGCGCSATPGAQRTGTTRAVALLTRPRPCGGFEPSAPAGSCDTGRPATEGRRQRRGGHGAAAATGGRRGARQSAGWRDDQGRRTLHNIT